MSQLPYGFAEHPEAPGWMYELANPNNVVPVPQAPPAPPQAQAGAYTQQMTEEYSQAQQHGQPQQAQYGTADSSLVDEEIGGLSSYGAWNTLYLDMPKLDRVGDEASMRIRFMPPWSMQEKLPYISVAEHSVPAGLVESKAQFPRVTCYTTRGGSGDCPVCRVLEQLLAGGGLSDEQVKDLRKMQKKSIMRWQGLNLGDVDGHWQQRKDESGAVQVDAAGQPVWQLVPGIFTARQKLQRQLLTIWKEWGDPTSPDYGYAFQVTKRKIGPDQLNVEYNAMPTPKEPIDPALRSVLGNLIDMQQQLFFRERSVMDQVASGIAGRFQQHGHGRWQPHPSQGYERSQPQYQQGYERPSPPVAQGYESVPPPPLLPSPPDREWFAHPDRPGYEYNRAGHVRPIAAVPAAPPPPPPPPPAAPPRAAGPQQGQRGPAAAAGRPPHAPPPPPPTAPGLHQGRPTGPAAPPPPPPGMAGAISPQQLEDQLRQSAQPPAGGYPRRPPPPGDIPF